MTDNLPSANVPPANPRAAKAAPRRSGGVMNALLNLLTVFLLLGTFLSGAGYGVLFFVPTLLPPLFRPPEIGELPPTAFIPTSTATSSIPTLPPAWTATPTTAASDTPSPTDTAAPTATESASATPTETPGPTATGPTPTATRTLSALPYTLQGDAPVILRAGAGEFVP